MVNCLTNRIGLNDVTSADDYSLSRVLNETLNEMDEDRKSTGYSGIVSRSMDERIERLETVVLVLATVISRRLNL